MAFVWIGSFYWRISRAGNPLSNYCRKKTKKEIKHGGVLIMPYTVKDEKKQDPPRDPMRFGRMQDAYIARYWKQLFKAMGDKSNDDRSRQNTNTNN